MNRLWERIFYNFINGRRYKMNYFHHVSLLPPGGNPLTVFPRPHRLSQQPLHIASRPGATRRTNLVCLRHTSMTGFECITRDDDIFGLHYVYRVCLARWILQLLILFVIYIFNDTRCTRETPCITTYRRRFTDPIQGVSFLFPLNETYNMFTFR